MESIAGLPFVRLKFNKNGKVKADAPVRPKDVANLIVIAHGWKNDKAAADGLYSRLLENMRALPGGAETLHGGRFGVTGIYWPAFVFKPDLTLLDSDAPAAAGAVASAEGGDLSRDDLDRFAEEVAAFLKVSDLASFKKQVKDATGGGGAASDLADRLRQEAPEKGADEEVLFEHEGRKLPGAELFEFLKNPPADPNPPNGAEGEGEGAAQGGTRGSGTNRPRFLSGARAAVARMLNQATYFEMKKRAGIVGERLAVVLEADGLEDVGLHLVGHSFGARLVTSAASRLQAIHPRSMTLLQAAYSHNGMGIGRGQTPRGAFRNVVEQGRVKGPIVATHTHNDRAVGLAYVIASRASGSRADFLGGPDDPFGGMGANGAQLVADSEAVAARLASGRTPELKPGVINNLLADDVISDHNDVTNVDVARVVLQAVQAS